MEMDRRKLKILAAIVEEYLRTGETVSSKWLSQMPELSVSSATVRNEMAVLFELGLLEQPHTSAGRIPSQSGLRLYVDRLMLREPLTASEKNAVDSLFNTGAVDIDRVLEEACKWLSHMTGCAVIATTPKSEKAIIDSVSIFKVSPKNVIAALVLKSGEVKSRHFRLDYDIASGAIEMFQNWANELLYGKPIEELTSEYLQRILFSSGENMILFTPLLAALYSLAMSVNKREVYITGSTNLLSYDELKSCAFDLLRLLDNKDELLSLFPDIGVETAVVIGKESKRRETRDASFIVASYKGAKGAVGHIAIVGPTRMDYPKLISLAERFAQNMTRVYSRHDNERDAQPVRDMSPQGELRGE